MNLLLVTLAGILRDSSPIVFAGLGETLNERGGVVNLSVEGTIELERLQVEVGAAPSRVRWHADVELASPRGDREHVGEHVPGRGRHADVGHGRRALRPL